MEGDWGHITYSDKAEQAIGIRDGFLSRGEPSNKR